MDNVLFFSSAVTNSTETSVCRQNWNVGSVNFKRFFGAMVVSRLGLTDPNNLNDKLCRLTVQCDSPVQARGSVNLKLFLMLWLCFGDGMQKHVCQV